jgi:hypothetical protein
MSRDAAAEPAVYISTLKALLDAASGAAEERAQGIAEAVVQELMVDTCSVALRRRGEAEARLVGHARRWDAGAPALDETQALALARLAGGEDDRLYFVRRNGVVRARAGRPSSRARRASCCPSTRGGRLRDAGRVRRGRDRGARAALPRARARRPGDGPGARRARRGAPRRARRTGRRARCRIGCAIL